MERHLLEPQISGCSDYLASSISAHSINTHGVAILDRLKGGVTMRRCQNFDHQKPEEAEVRRLFELTTNGSANNVA